MGGKHKYYPYNHRELAQDWAHKGPEREVRDEERYALWLQAADFWKLVDLVERRLQAEGDPDYKRDKPKGPYGRIWNSLMAANSVKKSEKQ
jgi:hypothetical protein